MDDKVIRLRRTQYGCDIVAGATDSDKLALIRCGARCYFKLAQHHDVLVKVGKHGFALVLDGVAQIAFDQQHIERRCFKYENHR